MAQRMVSRLQQFFEERADGTLRSIVKYEPEGFDIVYLRDDVAAHYTESELASAVDDSRMGSLEVGIYEDAFTDDHGDLVCVVQCFEHVVEMNFVLDDGIGAAVALDSEALAETRGLVGEAREIVVAERV